MINDLNLYRVFYIVAKYKNISHAAEKLYISQPAVSKSIKNLENYFKIKLFTRNSKGVILTKEGEELFTHIEKAYKELSLGEEIINKLKNKEIGTINLGISSILGKNYFIPKLENFITTYPNFKIKIINKHTEDDLELIKESKLDLAIVCGPISDNNIEFIKLEKANDIFVANPNYLKSKSIKDINDIFSKGSFMLLEQDNATRKHIDNYFHNIGVSIVPDIEASNMEFLIDCAKMGLGITSVLIDFVRDDLKNKTLVEIPLESPINSRYIGVAYKKDSVLSIADTTLIEYLKNSCT